MPYGHRVLMTRGILSAMPGCPSGTPGEPTAYRRVPAGWFPGYPRADNVGEHYRPATSPNAEFPMVTAARVPAGGTWSNTAATVGNVRYHREREGE